MSTCPFAWDSMAAVTGPAGTRGCSLPQGQTFHDTAIPTNSAVTWPPGETIGRVRITKSIIRVKDPCALSDFIAETVHRNPNITAFHVRPSGADYSRGGRLLGPGTGPPPPPLRALRAHLVTKGQCLLAIHRVAPKAPENSVPFAGPPENAVVT